MKTIGDKQKRACIIRQKAYPIQRNLRRNAENLTKNGYEVDVICVGRDDQPREEVIAGVKVHRVYYSYHRNSVFWYLADYLVFFLLVSIKLAGLTLKSKFDVIEVCNVPDFLVFATIFPKLLGSKVIFYMFEKTEALFCASFNLSRRNIITKLYNFITRMCVHYADHVIFTDVLVQQQVIEEYSIPESKTTLILNSPDDAVFSLSPQINKNGDHVFQITVVSIILKRYGIQTLIKTIPLLLKDIPELKVEIVGEGDFLKPAIEMADDMGVSSYLNFTGNVPYEDVPGYIAKADVCIAPMIDDVGTPNKIIEYFALGKATISTDSMPGVKALVDDNCIVYYPAGDEVELANCVLDLYRNPEKRESLGQAARVFYQQYSWPVMLERYLGVYSRLSN